MMDQTQLSWLEDGEERSLRWQSESGQPAPRKLMVADDTMNADKAWRLACEGTALLWRGDFQNARQLLQAMGRRVGRGKQKPSGSGKKRRSASVPSPRDTFNQHRLAQSQRARKLGMLLIPVAADYCIPLRRAPDVSAACVEAYGLSAGGFVVSLRELLGLISAHEWRKNGVLIPALEARIHPHYGVFSPVRSEYIDLVASTPLPAQTLAFDVGTGSGVLAAMLAQRGVARIVATDQDARALACARDNIELLGLSARIEVQQADLFPAGRAPLVVCNPPWLPARPSSPLEHAIYDPDNRMLRGFLAGLAEHLEPGGEGWLILSDFAEHLGLRTRDELTGWIEGGSLKVIDRHDTRPKHPRAADADDPLHAARAAEVTSLWRLRLA
jgi:methylase of polypeptide subunit release factors